MRVKRRGNPAVDASEVRMPARVAKEGGGTPPPYVQGFLGKVHPPRVSRDLSRGRQTSAMDDWLIFQYHLDRDPAQSRALREPLRGLPTNLVVGQRWGDA